MDRNQKDTILRTRGTGSSGEVVQISQHSNLFDSIYASIGPYIGRDPAPDQRSLVICIGDDSSRQSFFIEDKEALAFVDAILDQIAKRSDRKFDVG